jgi:signal transduction histidine kinase
VGENDFKEELIFFLRSPLSDGDKSRIGCASCQYELLLLRARNEHDSRRRDLFLGLVSHELKTPLTAISGVLQLLSRDDARLKSQLPDAGVFLDRRQHFNEVLQRQVLRLTELIDGLLDLSRIRMGRFGVDPIRCNISDILRNAVMPRLTLAASESLLQLRLESPDQLDAVADPIRIEELIVNLGMQAIRFSPEGAIVWMRLYVDSDRKEWVLRVRDQGKPWPSEDRERLFLPYETAERGGRMGGAGLGLYLARQIAQLHGGQVQWLSPNGQFGNQLEARMPLVAPSPLQSSS